MIDSSHKLMYIIYDEQAIKDSNHRFESSLFNNTKFGLAVVTQQG